jgi:ADP-heptose:LPS heptosyltransferase
VRRLLIRPGAIGDFIVSLPAMEALREEWTEVWCGRANVALARFADRATAIADVGLDRLGFLPAEKVIERLRGFDSIISWYGTNNQQFQKLTRDDLKLNIAFVPALPEGTLPKGPMAAWEFYRRQAIELGANQVGRYPRLPCSQVERSFAAIHPFASGRRKEAPIDLFRSVAQRLEARMPVRWLRGPEDALSGAIHIPDLYDLACWLAGARVYVGNDSGVAHLAAAVGTPVLALSPTGDPRVWTPRGPAVSAMRLYRSGQFHD